VGLYGGAINFTAPGVRYLLGRLSLDDGAYHYTTVHRVTIASNPAGPGAVYWTTPPADQVLVGSSFLLEYGASAGSSGDTIEVRYGTDPDVIDNYDYATGTRTGLPGDFSTMLALYSTGTWYFVVAAEVGAQTLYAPIVSCEVVMSLPSTPDSYEDDDTYAAAASLAVDGAIQSHGFHDTGDLDWVSFAATSGETYVIQTTNLLNCDTIIILYDTDGTTELDYDDDGGSEPWASRLSWNCPASGTYYARISELGGESGAGVTYRVFVRRFVAVPDGWEPDDAYTSVNAITVDGASQSHDFHTSTDVDYISFSATSGTGYDIVTFNWGASCYPYLTLYDRNGTTVLDSGADVVYWSCSVSGTYYVGVEEYYGNYGSDATYDMAVTSW
jgi:hypothetical protein